VGIQTKQKNPTRPVCSGSTLKEASSCHFVLKLKLDDFLLQQFQNRFPSVRHRKWLQVAVELPEL
jgi:hypothetical protein